MLRAKSGKLDEDADTESRSEFDEDEGWICACTYRLLVRQPLLVAHCSRCSRGRQPGLLGLWLTLASLSYGDVGDAG